MPDALAKWNSRLVAVAAAGISTLATAPDLPHDIRAVGITAVALAGIIMIGLRDIFTPARAPESDPWRDTLHDLGVEHPAPADIPPTT